jgi:O-antigen/teichoic acid export membrane protein
MSNTKRIAKNTLMLYFRQILTMLVSLYTVRVVLNTLGAEDYGIYNVVAGVVTMFGFLSGSMATASQRYFSFELGRGGDYKQLRKIFSLIFTVYILIGILILLLAETVGLWFVNNKLVIPDDRIDAARWIYQCAILSFLLTMITTPYMASVIAHENMNVYAYTSIIEAILKLLIVYSLQIINIDTLKLYGSLIFIVTFINTGIYRLFCIQKYKECRLGVYWDYALFKELTVYMGWNLFGTMSSVVKNQGINILLNMYFGPIVNAAQTIAGQINSTVLNFARNFSTAMRPQIIKTYASGNIINSWALVISATKATFFLLFFFILPLQLELSFMLKLWLKQIPEYVLIFVRIMLMNALIDSIGYPLFAVSQATGRIKLFQLIAGGIEIFNLPIALVVLIIGFSAVSVQIVVLTLSIFAIFARIFILSRQLQFSVRQYFKNAIIPIVYVLIVGSGIPIFFRCIYPAGLMRLFLTVMISIMSVIVSVFVLGLSQNERLFVIRKIKTEFLFKGIYKICRKRKY